MLLLGTSFPARALARTTCAYSAAPVNTLAVRVSGEAVATVHTDTIMVRLGDVDFDDVDLCGGPSAPGATLGGEGASEIDIEISTDLGAADIIGTAGDDEWHWGRGSHEANPALNLNPREAGDQDVDVTATREAFATAPIIANGGGGNDTTIGAPGAKLRGVVIAHGGPGQDVLSAPAVPRDVIMSRDYARDTVSCGAGRDRLVSDRRDALRECEQVPR